jgi:hypothetical protein
MLGATPSPCPILPLLAEAVNVTTLNPLVVFALTVEVIEPDVLVTAVALDALQFHAT